MLNVDKSKDKVSALQLSEYIRAPEILGGELGGH